MPQNGAGTGARGPHAGGAGRGRPEDDDLVGEVSARLLAAGTPRRERLCALSLLGLLLDHADAAGSVCVSLERVAGELELPAGRAEHALAALVRVEAVRRSDDEIVVVGRQPPATGGLRLSAYLANVDAVLGHEDAEAGPGSRRRPTAFPADPPPSTGVAAGRSRRRSRRREPVLAALALTAVVLVATLGPRNESSTRLRSVEGPSRDEAELAGPPPSQQPPSSKPWVSWPEGLSAPAPGQRSVGGERQPSSPSERAEGDAGAAPGTPTVPGQTAPAPGDRRAGAPGADRTTAPAREPGAAPATDPDAAPGRPPPAPAPAAPAPEVRCPAGAPSIAVVSAVNRPAGPDPVPPGAPAASLTEVRGTLTNTTPAAVVIRSFEVRVGSGTDAMAVPGPPAPVTLAPGEQREWTIRTPAAAAPETAPAVHGARIVDWEWQEPRLAQSCSS